MPTTKILGWGKCSATNTPASGTAVTHDDIVENSTSLSVEEGQEQTANIEGGSFEGRKKQPDKYVLSYKRRLGAASEATPGFTENAGSVKIDPESVGAIGVTLTGVSLHVAIGFDATDGCVATYTYKTKGTTDANGALTDITLAAKASG